MTANNPMPVIFGFLYLLYQRYWLICREFELGVYDEHVLDYLQDRLHEKLIVEYKSFKFDEAELDWICEEIEANNLMLNPFDFTENPMAFIVHAQSCYFLSLLKNEPSVV